MRRAMLAAVLSVTVLALWPGAASAQTVQTGECAPGVPSAADMAGVYISPEWRMRITVYPCGTTVLWANDFGMHDADYRLVERRADGLMISRLMAPSVSLDNRISLGVKPAEPGFIQAITVSPFGDEIRVYRLQKLN